MHFYSQKFSDKEPSRSVSSQIFFEQSGIDREKWNKKDIFIRFYPKFKEKKFRGEKLQKKIHYNFVQKVFDPCGIRTR